jgi:hypothetical protein
MGTTDHHTRRTDLSDLTASASYFLAAIAENGDRELADDTYRAVAEVLPNHLRAALDDAYDTLALA